MRRDRRPQGTRKTKNRATRQVQRREGRIKLSLTKIELGELGIKLEGKLKLPCVGISCLRDWVDLFIQQFNGMQSSVHYKAPFIGRKVVPGKRVTFLPELPWASQLFLHFLTVLDKPFT